MNDDKRIKQKLEQLKKEIKSILKHVNALERSIFDLEKDKNNKDSLMTNDSSLKSKFVNYLKNVANVKDTTIYDYLDDLNLFKAIVKHYLNKDVCSNIFEINDAKYLRDLTQELLNNKDFEEFNRKKHHHYSAPLNNYVKFLEYENNSFVFED